MASTSTASDDNLPNQRVSLCPVRLPNQTKTYLPQYNSTRLSSRDPVAADVTRSRLASMLTLGRLPWNGHCVQEQLPTSNRARPYNIPGERLPLVHVPRWSTWGVVQSLPAYAQPLIRDHSDVLNWSLW